MNEIAKAFLDAPTFSYLFHAMAACYVFKVMHAVDSITSSLQLGQEIWGVLDPAGPEVAQVDSLWAETSLGFCMPGLTTPVPAGSGSLPQTEQPPGRKTQPEVERP